MVFELSRSLNGCSHHSGTHTHKAKYISIELIYLGHRFTRVWVTGKMPLVRKQKKNRSGRTSGEFTRGQAEVPENIQR